MYFYRCKTKSSNLYIFFIIMSSFLIWTEMLRLAYFWTFQKLKDRMHPRPNDVHGTTMERLWFVRIWRVQSIASLLLLQDLIWPWMVVPVRVPFMGQIEMFRNYSSLIGQRAKNKAIRNKYTKKKKKKKMKKRT